MALDIFSTFDDHNKVSFGMVYMIWVLPLILLLLMMSFKPTFKPMFYPLVIASSTVNNLLERTNAKSLGGGAMILSIILFMLALFNFTGMIPYVFSMTSHLAINMSLALMLWLSIMLMSMSFNVKMFVAHFQPSGSPALLNPFLCLIELVSNLVRPITLSVRLTANLSTGHILMGLLGSAFSNSTMILVVVISLFGVMYFLFEMAIYAIQSYIFILLSSLYMDEHPY